MENAQRKRCSQLPIESRGSVFTLVPMFWLESVLEKSDTVPQNSPADLRTVKAILKDCVVTKKDFILIKKTQALEKQLNRALQSVKTIQVSPHVVAESTSSKHLCKFVRLRCYHLFRIFVPF